MDCLAQLEVKANKAVIKIMLKIIKIHPYFIFLERGNTGPNGSPGIQVSKKVL